MNVARDAARSLALAVTAVAGMLREDPWFLAVQVARRLPRPLSGLVARGLLRGAPTTAVRAVVGHWLAGRRAQATSQVPAARPRGRLGARVLREVAAELEAVPIEQLPAGTTRARAAWRAGALTAAREEADRAGARHLAERYAAESAMLRPGFRVPTRPGPAPIASRARGGPRALHLLTNSYPHTSSGYAARSHAVLRAQAGAGIQVLAATRLGYPVSVGRWTARSADVVDGVTYARLLPARMPATAVDRAARTVDGLRPLARSAGSTVVHTTTPYGNGQIARALADEVGVPWVYEVRGLLEQTWVAGRPDAASRSRAAASERFSLLRAQEAAVAAAADHVVTLSATMRDDLVARGVPAERVTLVPNSVDERLLTLPDAGPGAARRDLGLPESGFWVGTVSSLVGYEGLDALVDAVVALRARGVDARACLVGDGVARPELERRAQAAGLGDALVLPGRVPAADAPRWHRALDVFVVPRRDVEVCRQVTPLKPVEAMALGRPVVASDLPALAEVLSGGAGRLVAPEDPEALADALDDLRSDEAARADLVAAGREVAAGRTWAAAGSRYRELYERLGAGA
ncbi:glycosyltransferase family 4 protein [Cellulomonas triticagri]|uniref:Glycosyltransferase n=1 Tax=Cellulomonas triticagri TaxID=2483352 RepID=A0A3M2JLW6_9CELL|nr:glycosyltransferase family 4 protein [Cellulomonas triticagri]RMI12583.1 glycosyltransferase [Cellulomonas triticagri]